MIKLSDGTVVGAKTKAKITKNRLGPPLREVEFEIYFDSGIDVTSSWIDAMTRYNLVKKEGLSYIYVNTDTGEEVKFRANKFLEIISTNKAMYDNMYKNVCEHYIMKYNPQESLEVTTIDTELSAIMD